MNFFNRNKTKKSGNDAKSRLKLVLYSEHQGLPPETIKQIKDDIITVISKYVDVDVENFDIKVSPDGNPSLQANIPIMEKNHRKS